MSNPDICPNTASCPLFPYFGSKSVLEFWKQIYCHAEYRTCRRYESASSGVRPPDTLLPNGDSLDGPPALFG